MAPPQFNLAVQELRPPTLPPPTDTPPSGVVSSLILSPVAATSSLWVSLSLPSARDTKNPLYPATHLQLSYHYAGSGEIFIPSPVTAERLKWTGPEADRYELEVLPIDIPRAKVNQGTTTTATLIIYAWKGEKMLGKWTAGQIEGLGIAGLKSTEVALLRQKTWAAAREAKARSN